LYNENSRPDDSGNTNIRLAFWSCGFPEYNYNFIMRVLRVAKIVILFVFQNMDYDEWYSRLVFSLPDVAMLTVIVMNADALCRCIQACGQ